MRFFSTQSTCLLAALSTVLYSAGIHAQNASGNHVNSGFSPLLVAGLTYGGDKLAEIDYLDDDDDEVFDRDIRAGGLLLFAAGITYRSPEAPWELSASYGYHFDSEDADNGDVEFERNTLDLIGYYHQGKHALGLGMTRHSNIEFTLDPDGFAKDTVDFDNENGWIVEYKYTYSHFGAIAVRYTAIEYSSDQLGLENIDGNHLGLIAYFSF